jgi:hypothetical protein
VLTIGLVNCPKFYGPIWVSNWPKPFKWIIGIRQWIRSFTHFPILIVVCCYHVSPDYYDRKLLQILVQIKGYKICSVQFVSPNGLMFWHFIILTFIKYIFLTFNNFNIYINTGHRENLSRLQILALIIHELPKLFTYDKVSQNYNHHPNCLIQDN